MLTREEAKTRPCPYMLNSSTPEYHQNGDGVAYTTYEYALCVAEECPRWVDAINIDSQLCPNGCTDFHREHCTVSGSCDACPKRYGRCGG